ncbi:MAG: ParB/RepB/Spo0J family partition protein [Acidobacteriota bacterium]
MSRKVLGRGIRDLISEDISLLRGERYSEIDIDLIKPNELQPRVKFSDDSLDELANSMKETGVLQPIIVVSDESYFRIVTGERRWRAAQKIGIKRIPAIIKKIPPEKQLELSLIENIQREDLNPLEIATAYHHLVEGMGLTQEEVAEKIGKDRSSIANYLRLLKLPKEIKDALAENKISMGHARALLSIENEEDQKILCAITIKKDLSVRELEKIIKRMKKKKESRIGIQIDPDILNIEEELRKFFGTQVKIKKTKKGGYISIKFFSDNELNRILKLMRERM